MLLAVSLSGCNGFLPPRAAPAAAEGAAIQEVVAQVQLALAHVQNQLAQNHLPPLKQVRLTLQTGLTRKENGTVKLLVFGAGADAEQDQSQSVVLTLVPPPPAPVKLAAIPGLTDDLENAILAAAEGVQKAGTDAVPLTLSGLEVTLGFTVKSDLSAGVSNVVLQPVTAGLGATQTRTSVQTLVVTFAGKS